MFEAAEWLTSELPPMRTLYRLISRAVRFQLMAARTGDWNPGHKHEQNRAQSSSSWEAISPTFSFILSDSARKLLG
jgi:hypothetical protein